MKPVVKPTLVSHLIGHINMAHQIAVKIIHIQSPFVGT
jgi:hypothetical protein